jgi:citrate synthase
MSATTSGNERARGDRFASRPATKIWQEVAASDNPYAASQARLRGYDLLELVRGASFMEVLFLLFKGELPGPGQAELLEAWWIASINPGPRHPATRAALNAGVSKANVANILPLALTVMGGDHLGAGEVKRAMRFLAAQQGADPGATAARLLCACPETGAGDRRVAPGFGSRFGSTDHVVHAVGHLLARLDGAGAALAWGSAFARALEREGMGWLDPAVAAATLIDLGFDELTAMGLFQLSRAPGLLAHGMEMVGQPLTAMPFLDDAHYIVEDGEA